MQDVSALYWYTIVVPITDVVVVVLLRSCEVGSIVSLSSHLHLPKGVLGVDRAAVIRVGVAVFHIAHVDPCRIMVYY